MMKSKLLAGSMIVTLVPPAFADDVTKEELSAGTKTYEFTRFASPAKRILLDSLTYMSSDCVVGDSDNTITKEPEHGVAVIEIIERYTAYTAESAFHKCNSKKHSVPSITYKAAIGYSGADTFEVTSISPSGFANVYRYTIRIIDRTKKQGRADLRP
jgi:hypothetical protein